jgi:hypothetical protein
MVRIAADGAAGPAGSGAWPFVVTRNRLLDWRPIVAPDFMIDRGGEYLLVHAADPGDVPAPSPLFERVVTTERYGDLTLLARSRQATADLIGGSAQEQLVDRVGRPIQLIEGLVLPGRHPGCAARWQAQLARVDAFARRAFPGFWQSEDEAEPPAPSQALTEAGPAAGHEIGPGQDAPGGATSDSGPRRDTGPVGIHGGGTASRRQAMTAAVTVIAGLALLYVLIRITRR